MSGPVTAYTDGAGPEHGSAAAWSFVVTRRGDDGLEILHAGSGLDPGGTNQTAELLGVIHALRYLTAAVESESEIVSDSAYVVNGLNDRWIDKWRVNGWTSSKGGPVANRILWEALFDLWDEEAAQLYIGIRHMRGHGRGDDAPHDVAGNHVADRIAEHARNASIEAAAEAGV